MFGQRYYNGTIRKYIIYFGTIFSDVWIDRDNISGNILQSFKIPISYGPKEKFLARLEGNSDSNREVAIQLPRMTFEITSMYYDSTRKLTPTGRQACVNSDGETIYAYNPIPYNFGIQLNIMVKNAEDGTRIVEQILPFFQPDFTATLNINPPTGASINIPLVLNDIGQSDTYEGSFEVRRALIWTLDFTLKGWLFGPTRTAGLIKDIDINFSIPPPDITVDTANATNSSNTTSIEITPGLDANGDPVSWSGSANGAERPDYSISINSIDKDDNWGYLIDFSGEDD